MKLLFIENRHKTYLYQEVAKKLKNQGHDIYCLVQNKQFAPLKVFENFIIEYPTKKNKIYDKDESVEEVIQSDRQINHFNKKDTSYFYYYNTIIEEYLKNLKPDFVFGESTAFHELLTIENCKKLNIKYLNPSTCRYPIGRFSFYINDTLEPYKGSNEYLSNIEAEEVIDAIIHRKAAPDYMKPSLVSKSEVLNDKLKKIFSYVNGEKYNTPSLRVKFRIEKEKDLNIKKWDEKAIIDIKNNNSIKVLYPMQMQPEANIDVWGKKYREQTVLIKKIASVLPPNTVLYVKPNPKSKYELSSELIDVVHQEEKIIGLHHSTKMDKVLPYMDLVVTVTGTIAIECILSNKPVATLTKTINNTARNCEFIQDIEKDIPDILKKVKNHSFNHITIEEKVNYIKLLNELSYKGVISDPFSDKNCISVENIESLTKAFEAILE